MEPSMDDIASPRQALRVFARPGLTYTSCYCEENIYCMIRDHVDLPDRKNYVVVFISNKEKYTPLFRQKAGIHPKIPVCWDYHVILIHRAATGNPSTVYDFDTNLDPFGLPFETYFSKTLYGDENIWLELDLEIDQETMLSFVARYPRFFKLVPAEDYLRLFASTRKHMMKEPSIHITGRENGSIDAEKTIEAGQENENTYTEKGIETEGWEDSWTAKPPDYPPIRTEESDDTLSSFLDFDSPKGDKYGEIVNEREFWQEFTGNSDYHGPVGQDKRYTSINNV